MDLKKFSKFRKIFKYAWKIFFKDDRIKIRYTLNDLVPYYINTESMFRCFLSSAPTITLKDFPKMALWYASLYVLIEGYQNSDLKDLNIDEFLKNTNNIKKLKDFRNATLHTQKDFFNNSRIIDCMHQRNMAKWTQGVTYAFSKVFRAQDGLANSHPFNSLPIKNTCIKNCC